MNATISGVRLLRGEAEVRPRSRGLNRPSHDDCLTRGDIAPPLNGVQPLVITSVMHHWARQGFAAPDLDLYNASERVEGYYLRAAVVGTRRGVHWYAICLAAKDSHVG